MIFHACASTTISESARAAAGATATIAATPRAANDRPRGRRFMPCLYPSDLRLASPCTVFRNDWRRSETHQHGAITMNVTNLQSLFRVSLLGAAVALFGAPASADRGESGALG